jgi:ketosteroid isomerase-like protein
VETYSALVGPAGADSSYRGHAGLREVFADLREAWERNELIPQEIVDAGNPIVILGHILLRARGSGIEFDTPIGSVLWVHRGLIVRQRDFADWDEALRIAGIQPDAASSSEAAGTKLSDIERQSAAVRSVDDT